MKCHVVYDKNGKIVSLGYEDLPPSPEAYDPQTPRFGPKAEADQTVAELEVPEEYARLSLTDITEQLQVDVQAKRPRLMAK